MHQKYHTHRGDYWCCSETGQLERTDFGSDQMPDQYDTHWQQKLDEKPLTEAQVESHRRWIARFAPYRSTGRLFEVGAGLGDLLQVAGEDGWQCEGCELSPVAARHAQQRTGAVVTPGAVENMTLDESAFDVVLLNNVFEHLEAPRAVLAMLCRALRPGGVLYLQTLNAQSFAVRTRLANWQYFGPGHLVVPTRVSLGHYYTLSNLAPLWTKTHGYRSSSSKKGNDLSSARRRFDKIIGKLAARCGAGHRIETLLQKQSAN